MKNILLLVRDDPGLEARLQAALDLCRAVGGHITCLDVIWCPPLVDGGFQDSALAVAGVIADEEARDAAAWQRLEQRLSHEDVSWNRVRARGEIAAALRDACDLADIIVLSRQTDGPSSPDMREIAGAVVVRSRRPTLVVPGDCKRLDPSSALVAWDGSPCAAAAVRAAVPLLRHAADVVLFEAGDGSATLPAEEAAAYLSRHDIHAVITRVPAGPGGAAGALLRTLATGAFGYVAMGGFGHSRLTEALFGGVTRTMLKESPVPILLAH